MTMPSPGFCSRENDVEPSILIERLRTVEPAVGPGGREHWATFPAPTQVEAWARGARGRACARPWALGRFAGWAEDSERNESVFFFSFSSKSFIS